MASCDSNALLQRAKLFAGLDAGTLQIIKTQLVCNWFSGLTPTPPPTPSLLLDPTVAPSAFAAYSVRKLRTAYAGNCMTVQRSSDSTQASFGFVNNMLDTASLLAFVGAGNGVVVKWFDQSGNGVDGTQAAATAPKIISGGSLVTGSNGLPALQFAIGNGFTTTNQTLSGSACIYAVAFRAWTSASYAPIIEWNYGATTGIGFLTTGTATQDWQAKQWLAVGNGFNSTHTPRAFGTYGAIADNTWHLIDTQLAAAGTGIWLDNVSIASTATNAAIAAITASPILIAANGGDVWVGDISEIIIYNAAQSATLQGTVRSNINASYAIY